MIFRIKNLQTLIWYCKALLCVGPFQNGETENNAFNFISIIATPLLLIEQSKLKYPFFPKY